MVKIQNKFFESDAIKELTNLTKKEIKAITAYKLVKVVKKINELGKIYMETKQKYLVQYGILTKDKMRYTFEGENAEKFNAEMKDLLEIENEFEFEKIALPGDIKLSTNALILLEDFIEIKE